MGVTVERIAWDKKVEASIQQFTVDTALRILGEKVQGGFDAEPVVVTDGVPGRDPRQVKPFGKIEFIRRPIMGECARWIMGELKALAPIGPGINGHYKDAFQYLINDVQAADADLDNVGPGDRVQIINTKIYARKLEGSRAKGRGSKRRPKKRALSAQAPNGIFNVVWRQAIARYGRSIFIDFRYRELNLGLTVMRRRTQGKKLAHPYAVSALYPTLNLYIKH